MGIAIRTEHLSKEYRLGVINHGMLYKDFQSWMARRLGKPDPHSQVGADHFLDQKDRFWALKDICFDIEQGDRVGIIGRNGAGKSTLLKLISRISAPTEGVIKIKGRVVSLLEVGTGFHPELTGRENIFLNGSILGMKRREIEKKLEEIIDFAELEKFIDTPVKRYSSGMYVRLAFSVAANLDSEILLADEVLAVGDIAFQKKCLGTMEAVSKDMGRTVIFVSHNMSFIEALCERVVLLDKGAIVDDCRNVRNTILRYSGFDVGHEVHEWQNNGKEYSGHEFLPTRLALVQPSAQGNGQLTKNTDTMFIEIEGEILENNPLLTIGYALYTNDNQLLYWTCHTDGMEASWPKLDIGKFKIRSQLQSRFLNEGSYTIKLMSSIHFQKWITDPEGNAPSISFSIQGGLSDSPYWLAKRPGLLAPVIQWERLS
jgi:lipopolysaccharide transport system ATP-binding protein